MRPQAEPRPAGAPEPKGADALDLRTRLALRPKEAASALGVSERTLRSMLPALPHLREGNLVLIPVDALREWLRERVKAEESNATNIADQMVRSLDE